MSLNHLKEIVDKFEALTNYEAGKQKNTELEIKVRSLQDQLKKSQEEVSQLKSLKINFSGREISLEEFEGERQNYTRKFYDEEIEWKALAKFEAEKTNLTANEINRLLRLPKKDRPPLLSNLLNQEKNKEVNLILKTKDSWPLWFKQSIEENIRLEVKTRLNDIFWSNVQEGVIKAKEEDWEPYLDSYLQEKISPFCNSLLLGRFIYLLTNQQIYLTCKKCKSSWIFKFTLLNITNLLETGETVFECGTQNCIEGIINRHQTYIHYSLGEAIAFLIGRPNMPS